MPSRPTTSGVGGARPAVGWGVLLTIALLPALAGAQPAGGSSADVLVLFGKSAFSDEARLFADQMEAAGFRAEVHPASKRFFLDKRLDGSDEDCRCGVETASLVLHFGHGKEENWEAHDGGLVAIDDVQFGDGRLRYLWFSSCRVMAHGPTPFDKPHLFDPAAPTANGSRNVFDRWGRSYRHPEEVTTTPLAAGLRMACGGSTQLDIPSKKRIVALGTQVALGGPPSDTFIHRFRADPRPAKSNVRPATPARVPLCITRGGSDPTTTPLFDEEMIEEANQHGHEGFLHIQFPVLVGAPVPGDLSQLLGGLASGRSVDPEDVRDLADVGGPPRHAPILTLDPLPLAPPSLVEAFLETGSQERLGFRRLPLLQVLAILQTAGAVGGLADTPALADRWEAASVYFHPCSGALALRSPATTAKQCEAGVVPGHVQLPELAPPPLAVLDALRRPTEPSSAAASVERVAVTPRRVDMYIHRVPQGFVEGESSGLECYLKAHRIEASTAITRRSTTDERLYPVIAEGGATSLDLGPHGRLLSASIPTRRIAGCRDADCKPVPLLPLHKARAQAFAEAAEVEGRFHEEPSLDWGYHEAPASCYQREMGIVYRFTFEPLPGERAGGLVVDVPAQEVEPWICVGERDLPIPENLPRGCEPQRGR